MANILDSMKNQLSFETVLLGAMKAPIVNVNRAKFLKKELIKYYPDEIVNEAIRSNPAKAGISKSCVNKIANDVINYETNKVTALSVAASLPGGAAAVPAAAADITSYFTFVLRAVQKLAYLYGFDQFDLNDDNMDSETMNYVLLFIGVMFGVQGAASALQKVANQLAQQVAKNLAKKALMKGAIYPIVKKIALKVGAQMTKQIFADTVASAIPVAGGVLSGGLTYIMYKPCCIKLKNSLSQYHLCDPNYYD